MSEDDLIQLIYDAALDPELWLEVGISLGDQVGASASDVFVAKGDKLAYQVIYGRFPSEYAKIYQEGGYFDIDLRVPRLLAKPSDTVVTTYDLITADELKRCPVHNEYLIPFGFQEAICWHSPVGNDHRAILAVTRQPQDERFQQSELDKFAAFMPHLKRALVIHHRMLAVGQQNRLVAATLDALSLGVLILDRLGHIVFSNRYASAVLQGCDGLSDRGCRLRALHARDNLRLQEILGGTQARRENKNIGGFCRIHRCSGKMPYMVLITPLPASIETSLNSGQTLVLINDPAESSLPNHDRIAHLYGLTSAEGRLVSALLEGKSLAEYGEEISISQNTVRWTLKNVFAKTHTKRQTELISQVLRDLWGLSTR